jgi:hypothetical protein
MVHTTPLRPSYLLALPPELLAHIVGYLPAPVLLRLAAACRLLHSLVAHSPCLQYAIELFADGLEPGPAGGGGGAPARARLRALLRRRARWRALTHTSVQRVSLGGPCSAYELVGGVFAKAARGRTPEFVAAHLPAAGRMGWTDERPSLGQDLDARDFAMDPSQDVIALVELECVLPHPRSIDAERARSDGAPAARIHIRTLSKNGQHPDAKVPILLHETGALVDSAVCQLADDALAFFWAGETPGLVIWNWQTGRKLVVRYLVS